MHLHSSINIRDSWVRKRVLQQDVCEISHQTEKNDVLYHLNQLGIVWRCFSGVVC